MQTISHPNVLSLIEILPPKPNSEIIDIVLPFCEKGTFISNLFKGICIIIYSILKIRD